MGLFSISPEAAEELRIRAKVLGKGVSHEQLRHILKTDKMVALQAVQTRWAADSRERTVKNITQINKDKKRLEKAEADIDKEAEDKKKAEDEKKAKT